VMGDNDANCSHLNDEMLHKFTDKKGVERVVAELCGRLIKKNGKLVGDPKSVKFIEASWVDKPAFVGAVLNHYVGDIPKAAAAILGFPTWKLSDTVESLFKMRVADRAGMIVIRVARAEMMRRMREDRIGRMTHMVARRNA